MILALVLALALAADPAAARPSTGSGRAEEAPAPVLAVPPRLLELVPPEVPPGTAFPAPEVEVVLAIDVSAAGEVEDVRVQEGAGEPFDSAAIAAARRFRFEPGRLDTGEPVPVTIAFRLRIASPPPPPEAAPPPPPVRLGGLLLERGTRRPLAGVAVAARAGGETIARATTGPDGRFLLEVPAASFELLALPPGHDRLEERVDAKPGEERDETFYLDVAGTGFETVVRARPAEREVTRQVIPAEEVARIPGTQGDTLGAVVNLPGVARPSFGGVQLVLRGSSPGDSRVFLNGQPIPILYHFGGLRSTVNPRFLDAVEFVPGNFAPDYGRATGGIVDVKLRDPADDLLRGDVTASFYDAGFSLEGPLGGGWSGGAAFHRSWIDTLLPLVIPSDASVSFDTAPRYYDYQFLASRKVGEGGKLRLVYFGSMDKIVVLFDRPQEDPKITGRLAARTMFHAVQAELSTPLGDRLSQESSLQVALNEFRTAVGPEFFFDLDVLSLAARSAWTLALRPGLSARAGVDVSLTDARIAANIPQVPKEGEVSAPLATQATIGARTSQVGFQPAVFAELRWQPVPRLQLFPGVRVDWYREIRRFTVDPRITARLELRPGTSLQAGAGIFQQPPQPDESAAATGNPDLMAERAVHLSAGVTQRLGEAGEASLTAFHKTLDRLVVRNAASAFDPAAPRFLSEGTGRIRGLEALVRARLGERVSGFVAYTFQRSLRRDGPGEPERRFDFDQPHILTAVATWAFARDWSVGGRFRLVSGNPDTPIHGSVLDAATGVYVPLYGAVNSTRLPAFAQLDVRLDRTWTYRTWKLTAFLDVQNATNRGNAEGFTYSYDYARRQPLTGLPVLPILGVEGAW